MDFNIRPAAASEAPVQHGSENFLYRILHWLRINLRHFIILLFVCALVLFFLSGKILKTLHSGEVGVMYYRFGNGTDTEQVYGEGTHLMMPWNMMYVYDARVQEVEDSIDVYAEDGEVFDMEYSVFFRPNQEKIGQLHQDFGPDYVEKIVLPEAEEAVREIMHTHSPEEIMAMDWNELQDKVLGHIEEDQREELVNYLDFHIEKITITKTRELAVSEDVTNE